jgi:DNA-binding NarL/FixJ family response regulator
MQKSGISIYIIDDEKIICEALSFILGSKDGYSIAGWANDSAKAMKDLKTINPSVILLDIKLKNENGIVLSERIKREKPDSRIIILSSYCNESLILMAAGSGVSAYTTKSMNIQDLTNIIHEVMTRNRFFLHDEYKHLIDPMSITMAIKNPARPLTHRETEILKLIAAENTTREIADKLHISEKTVRNHKSNIMKKLHIRSDAGLVRHAYTMALI